MQTEQDYEPMMRKYWFFSTKKIGEFMIKFLKKPVQIQNQFDELYVFHIKVVILNPFIQQKLSFDK